MGTESGKVKVVLVEDNPCDVFLVKLALEENGLGVEMINYRNGDDAIAELCPAAGRPSQPVPDVILLDLNTPRGDGFEVLARIRSDLRLADVPVAIVTSSASPADRRRAELLGATTYIRKPSALADFIEAIGNGVKSMLGLKMPVIRTAGTPI